MKKLVAPRAGAWIETDKELLLTAQDASPPVRGRGLKLNSPFFATTIDVAPRAGAWIETCLRDRVSVLLDVAPRAGAWIETSTAIPDA